MKKDNIIKKILLCIYPVIFWIISQIGVSIAFQFYYTLTMLKSGNYNIADLTTFINENAVLILLISSLINIIFFGFILLRNKTLHFNLYENQKNIKYFLSIILLGISFFMFSMGIIDIFDLTKYSANYTETMALLSSGGVLINIISVGIITPISEEFMLRGIVYNNLKRYVNFKTAIILQALIFGIMHMNIIQSTYAVIAGIIIGYIYEKSQSLVMSCVFHISFNICNHLFSLPILSDIMSYSLLMTIIGVLIFYISFKYFLNANKKIT